MVEKLPYEAVLLDIEGTITPVSFVYDTLFPFAHDRLRSFLEENWHDAELQEDVTLLRRQLAEDRSAGQTDVLSIPQPGSARDDDILEAVVDAVHAMMDADRKVTALKSLQGKIWRDGYESGLLRGEFYEDVPRALSRWYAHGIPVAIYSSGSVEAQQLLFRHAEEGDLTEFICDWFDTTTGAKRDPGSYQKIARRLRVPPQKMLFATDVVAEAEAAHQAGMQAVIMSRSGNESQPSHKFPVEENFELV